MKSVELLIQSPFFSSPLLLLPYLMVINLFNIFLKTITIFFPLCYEKIVNSTILQYELNYSNFSIYNSSGRKEEGFLHYQIGTARVVQTTLSLLSFYFLIFLSNYKNSLIVSLGIKARKVSIPVYTVIPVVE